MRSPQGVHVAALARPEILVIVSLPIKKAAVRRVARVELKYSRACAKAMARLVLVIDQMLWEYRSAQERAMR